MTWKHYDFKVDGFVDVCSKKRLEVVKRTNYSYVCVGHPKID